MTADKPTRQQAEEAVKTLIRWAGDDPEREGLLDTPSRVVKSYDEFFSGYGTDPEQVLARTFSETEGYDETIILRDIRIESHCEHHMVPIIGQAHVAYIPSDKVVGISKLARIVETFAKRLQTQETMTAQIANVIDKGLTPRGTAVFIEAEHQCMSMRGVNKPNVATITTRFTGVFQDDSDLRNRFLGMINNGK